MSSTKTSIVPVHIYTNYVYFAKPVRLEGKDYAQNIVSFSPGVKIDIPDIKFGYNLETKELMYKKDGGEWTPMK